MKEFVYMGELFNIYKGLLSKQSCEYYSLYYEENLSLQEIAEVKNVSKSYVGNLINKTSNKLEEYEKILKIYDSRCKLNKLLLCDDVNKIKDTIKNIINDI